MKQMMLLLVLVLVAGCPGLSSVDGGAGSGGGAGGGAAYDSGFVPLLPPGFQGQANAVVPIGSNVFVVGSGASDGGVASLLVARVKPDRTLDPTWNGNGVTLVDVENGGSAGLTDFASDTGYAALVDGDLLYVGGTAQAALLPGEGPKVLLARFLANGQLDTSFGNTGATTGVRLDAFGTGTSTLAACTALLKQPDGKILAGGNVQSNFFVTRYLPSGTADVTFSKTPGTGFGAVWGTSRDERVRAMVLDPDGKIVVFGGESMSAARLLPDGQLDTSFGTAGYASSAGAEGTHLWREVDGSYLALGFDLLKADGGQNQLGIRFLKWTSSGVADTSFGPAGFRQVVLPGTGIGLGTIRGAARLADGRFLLYLTGLGATYLARFNADFTLDTGFLDAGALKPLSIKLPLFQPSFLVGQHLAVTDGNRVWVADITNVVIEPVAPTTKNFFEVISSLF